MNKQEAIKKINLEMFAYPNLEPEEDDGPPIDFKNGYNAASKANIKIINQLNESRGASWQDAIEILEDHFSCEIPRNLDQVIEGFKSMSGLMNSVEFELDKRGSKLTSKEFVLEALERYKQKVKVPAFVAPFIEKLKITNRRYGVELEKAYNNGEDEELVNWLWFNENVLTLFRALENGYEIEEEPKYSVLVAGKYLIKMFHGRKDHKFVNEAELESWHSSAYKLTQKEIKSIDERYWPFAVPVEKVWV
ncbi:hypothetical protein AUF12_05415 [Enterococcus avium]|uniref:DUF1642 domain-containing protein n=1 Tax=Enterococcus avium TaxID=33945 RepID=UPI000C9B1BA0|nr:DUF1642 domain-containing protein [Enterococcus avium]PNE49975.1 hypothetical protein AUF12_05415 [Enterococcus avium]